MANQEYRSMLLDGGVAVWNRWRDEEPDTLPDLRGADLGYANLKGVNLRGADLIEAQLSEAELQGADLRGANLAGACLRETDLRNADLRGAILGETDLADAVFDYADLRGAQLEKSNLHFAHCSGANLTSASLREADLTLANLTSANLSKVDLSGADLSNTNLTGANLTGANLTRARCLETNFSAATLSECNVYGIAAWDLQLGAAVQANLNISPFWEEGGITVDNLEVAQFLYMLLNNKKVRAVLDIITSKVVLILGRFSNERKPVLDALREALRNHPNGYIPVLFDFEPQADKPVLETVKTLANLARFVIADLTDPHMVRAELTALTMSAQSVPIQPIIHGDDALPTEYDSWALARLFLPVHRYIDLSDLLANLTESVITPVEAHVQARRL